MKAVIFDTNTSTLKLDREIQLLRLSYLFADSLCAGGQVASNISFVKDYRKFSLNKKLQYILLQISDQDYPEKEKYVAEVEKFIGLSKKAQGLKRMTRETIVAINKSTALYTNWFDDMAVEIIEQSQKLGIVDMYSWVADKVLGFAIQGLSACEERRPKEVAKNAKELLELLFPTNTEESSILVFPVDLIENNYLTPEEREDLVEKEGVLLKGVNIYNCIDIPAIAALTALELKALRSELNESFKEFRGKVDKWIQYCRQNDEINSQIKNLKEEVLPCSSSLQEVIKNNQLLNIDDSVKLDTLDFIVFIGIAPVESIWRYYQEFKVLDKETMDIMRETIALGRSYPKYLPVICIVPSYRHLEKLEEMEQKEKTERLDMTRKKKSLFVD